MKFTEEQLKQYAAPLSKTEDQMCKNAIIMVRDALKVLGFTDNNASIKPIFDDTYAYSIKMYRAENDLHREITIFIQGSYANNTNVRTQSDVDIAVVQEEVFRTKYRTGIQDSNYGFTTAKNPITSFKDEVQEALEKKFGSDVERKNKSIKVNGNSYRKDTDTVPSIRYKDYSNDYTCNSSNYVGGIMIYADDGTTIINYPEQHIQNGKIKNRETNFYYKKMVRIIKKMRYIMEDHSYDSSKKVSSFLLESLLWNLPNEIFMKYLDYKYIFEDVIKYAYSNMDKFYTYKEANGIKPLCPTQVDIDKLKKFIMDLYLFYDYE